MSVSEAWTRGSLLLSMLRTEYMQDQISEVTAGSSRASDLPKVLHIQAFASGPREGVLLHVLVGEVPGKLASDSISLQSFYTLTARIAQD